MDEAIHTTGIQYRLLLSRLLLRIEAAFKTLLSRGVLSFNSFSSFVNEKLTSSLLVLRKMLGFFFEHMAEHSRLISFKNWRIICSRTFEQRHAALATCVCVPLQSILPIDSRSGGNPRTCSTFPLNFDRDNSGLGRRTFPFMSRLFCQARRRN